MTGLVLGAVPRHIRQKAATVLDGSEPRPGTGWKKLQRVRGCYSFKLGKGFRLLWLRGDQVILCNHDRYMQKINAMHPRGHGNAPRV